MHPTVARRASAAPRLRSRRRSAPVPRLRHFLAAFVGVLLLQLTLQESVWTCVSMTAARGTDVRGAPAEVRHEHGTAMHQHAHGTAMASASAPVVDVGAPAQHRPAQSPCCTPDALHGGCGTASAATVATIVEADVGLTTPHAPVRWPRVADVPPSLRAAPDVPPPKA